MNNLESLQNTSGLPDWAAFIIATIFIIWVILWLLLPLAVFDIRSFARKSHNKLDDIHFQLEKLNQTLNRPHESGLEKAQSPPQIGPAFEVAYCPKCQHPNDAEDQNCTRCGSPLKADSK